MTIDRLGRQIAVGMRVRVLSIPESLKASLAQSESERVTSMIGEVFEIYEIDDHGQVWVEKWWKDGEHDTRSHSLGLEAHEYEVV